MLLKDISFSSPEENILFDDVLLFLAEKGASGEVLRLWEIPNICIVLGRIGKIERELHLNSVKKDGIPVLKRSSGGGTVIQGKGCLNYSLILSKGKNPDLCDLGLSYRIILEKIIAILQKLGVEAVFKPVSDICTIKGEKKISGNAQRRGRKYILHHGTILYDFDISLMERYLKIPAEMPGYRRNRPHSEFVMNIPIKKDEIKSGFCEYFAVNNIETVLNNDEGQQLKEFLSKKSILTGEHKFLDK